MGIDPAQNDAFDDAYHELRDLAGRFMDRERPGHTLQPTALVHEVYLKLNRQKKFEFTSHGHFVALAAQAMRQVLVDLARRKGADKRKGIHVSDTFTSIPESGDFPLEDVIAVHRALEDLERQPPNGERQVRLVELVWFGGLDFTEASAYLGLSRRQAHRDWAWARAYLKNRISAS